MKKLTVLLVIMLVAVLFIGCSPPIYRITPNLAGNTVTFDKVAGTATWFQLEMTYSGNGMDVTSDCNYDLDVPGVVTVSNEGLITAVAAGTATIHITYWNGVHEYFFDVIAIVIG